MSKDFRGVGRGDVWKPLGTAIIYLVRNGIFADEGAACAALKMPLSTGRIRAGYADIRDDVLRPNRPVPLTLWNTTSASWMATIDDFELVAIVESDFLNWLNEAPCPAVTRGDGGDHDASITASRPANVAGEAKAPPLALAKEKELPGFLVQWDADQIASGSRRNENAAWRAAEKHFEATISRDQLRKARTAKGKPGRPRKNPAEKPARNPAKM